MRNKIVPFYYPSTRVSCISE